ncbi:putative secreted protein [Streptomyces avermitilis MA-4680 = NBRC 14893]|uniref:Secreted protein n=1 Tax=Streptomyces avermitilis (strain ATCC 31267 / DSM 46492 / JCM 5070 / NBRC 14893 / NCIMB 12804 / NRRL 8165 / MA-4680) TaxID=227882 RepID=Q82LK0_STRAW|nr:putative secreted protein [Streptomyces avermitilis MA-4680 = NBRC 14893]
MRGSACSPTCQPAFSSVAAQARNASGSGSCTATASGWGVARTRYPPPSVPAGRCPAASSASAAACTRCARSHPHGRSTAPSGLVIRRNSRSPCQALCTSRRREGPASPSSPPIRAANTPDPASAGAGVSTTGSGASRMRCPAGVRKWSCGGRGCRKASPRFTRAASWASVPFSRPVTGSAASMTRRCAAVGGRVTAALLPSSSRRAAC